MINFVHSALWSMSQRYIPSLIHIFATLIITRFILPSDFGEVALVTTFSQISCLFVSSGLGEGLIYNVKNNERMFNSVFFTNILIAFLFYSIMLASSNWIAKFYDAPRLSILIKVIGLNVVIYSLSYLQRIKFQIAMAFRSQAFISLVAAILASITGVAMAFLGFGVWSIVSLTLSLNFIETILLWIKSEWHPQLQFSWNELKNIIPYSSKILLNNILQTIYDNIYSLVIGKTFTTKQLGYYNRMQTVVYYTTTNFMYSIEIVFFPMLCKKKEFSEKLSESYEKLLRISLFLSLPILMLLIGLAKPIIVIVLTEKWIDSVIVLQLVAIAYLFVPILYINNSFLKITNNTNALFVSNIIKKLIGTIILLVTLQFSFYAVCCGIIAYYFIDAVISIICTHRYVGISVLDQIVMLRSNFIINIACLEILHIINYYSSNIWLSLICGLITYFAMYFSISKILNTREYVIFLETLKKLKLIKREVKAKNSTENLIRMLK